jgi:hypothetical protein
MLLRCSVRRLAALVLSLSLLLVVAPPAHAATGTPDDTWMTNGTVYALVRAGNYVYVGGQFTNARLNPPGQGGSVFAHPGIVRVDAATGAVDTSWKVDVTNSDGTRATVYSIAVAGGKVFFGGTFDRVDGQVRSNIAAVSETDAALDAFAPVINKNVRAMTTNGSTVYAGGYFTSIGSVARNHLAAFDTSGALSTTWKPRTNGSVRSLSMGCGNAGVYASGLFASASGSSGPFTTRDTVALFDATTGALDPWSTRDAEIKNGAVGYDVDVDCAAQRLFVGIGGINFLFAFDISTNDGALLWQRQSSGNVQTVAVNDQGTADTSDDRVYFGGHFGGGVTYPAGACSQSKPKTARFGVADMNGTCDLSWWPNFEGKFFGPWAILVTDNGSTVWVGGQYTQVCDGNTNACATQYFLSRFSDV